MAVQMFGMAVSCPCFCPPWSLGDRGCSQLGNIQPPSLSAEAVGCGGCRRWWEGVHLEKRVNLAGVFPTSGGLAFMRILLLLRERFHQLFPHRHSTPLPTGLHLAAQALWDVIFRTSEACSDGLGAK